MFQHGNAARPAAASAAAALTLAVVGLLAGAPGAAAAALSGSAARAQASAAPSAVALATSTPATSTPATSTPATPATPAPATTAPGTAAPTPLTPTAFTAPTYTCTVTSGAHSANRMARIPIKLQDTGPGTVGSTDRVTLSSPGTALGGPFPAGTSAVGFSGALPVMGAQAGRVPLAGAMTDSGGGVFSVSGRLVLHAAGLDHILPPARFTVTIHAASVISVVVSCVLTTAMAATMPSAVAVRVTPRGTAAVPLMSGATPAGAPATGGGGSLHHAGDVAGIAAGGAVMVAGLGITLTGIRRRRRRFPA